MRTALGLILLLSGCSLALNNDELRFGDAGDAGDAGPDGASDVLADILVDVGPSCSPDEQCPTTPGRLAECRDGTCIDLGCIPERQDCDDVAGNGCEVDVRTSVQHCGACDEVCAFSGAAAICGAGVCMFDACRSGFENCDANTANGCETDLSRPAACGGCRNVCPGDRPLCDTTTEGFACVANCGDNTRCDATCADLDTSIGHCGSCGRVCPDMAGATTLCTAGECGFACADGFDDCDMNDANGCEVSLQSDLLHCGECDSPCDAANTVSTCELGACAIAMCEGSFMNCDADETSGCESNVATSSLHCGGCNNPCDGPCVDGICDPVIGGDGGATATCVVRASGIVECWGLNSAVEFLGLRTFENGGPVAIQRVDGMPLLASSVSLGNLAACAVDLTGKVWCWGAGAFGQLGDGTGENSSRPVRVTGSPEFEALTLSSVQTHGRVVCAHATDNSVWCWGRNGDFGGRMVPGAPATVLPNPIRADVPPMRAISVGTHHVCGITMSEDVMCWGDGTFGELGQGKSLSSATPVDASAAGFDGVVELALLVNSTCARTRSGHLWCWGYNTTGELGLGDRAHREVPAMVPLDNVREIEPADHNLCARRDDGLYCWGRFNSGVTGLPDAMGVVGVPTRIDGPTAPASNRALNNASGLFGGVTHICALVEGMPRCWGANERGQLGTTDSSTYFAPTSSDLSNVTDVALGATHGCALSGGAVYCWGSTSGGRLGRTLGVVASSSPEPIRMPLSNVTSLAVGTGHTCAAHEGIVSCWGGGSAANQVLGVVSPLSTTDPRQVPMPSLDVADEWVEVSAGALHSCARSMTGRVACWGDNTRNELGRTDTDARAPGFVADLNDAVALELGQYRSLALRSNGELVWWGQGVSAASATPQPVLAGATPLSNVVALSAGRFHACAISDPDGGGGTVYCWGYDNSGQLGLSVLNGRDEAVAVPGLDDVVSVSGGHFHSCAARASGEVLCWGNGVAGQIADASRPDIALPTVVSGLEATALFGGHSSVNHTFALRRDGTLVCWGNNVFGTCGAGERLYFSESAPVLGL